MRTERPKAAVTKAQLLRAAERLFALEGLDAVSLRRIAAEAGQRNGSVAQYHFGSREALIDALVERRMTPINTRRRELYDRLRAESDGPVPLLALVTAMVLPLAEQLLDADEGAYYVRFVGELFARGQVPAVLAVPRPWNDAFFAIVTDLRSALPDVPGPTLDARLVLMAGHMVQAMSAAELALRGLDGETRRNAIRHATDSLVDYIAGALVGPVRSDVGGLLAPPTPLGP